MLMNPSKPIPHPVAVGDSVTHPNHGYSISGKAVAALTRIHTQGRGSITIIRTKGWIEVKPINSLFFWSRDYTCGYGRKGDQTNSDLDQR